MLARGLAMDVAEQLAELRLVVGGEYSRAARFCARVVSIEPRLLRPAGFEDETGIGR